MQKSTISYIVKLAVIGAVLSLVTAALVTKFAFIASTINTPNFAGAHLDDARKTASRMGLDLKVEDETYSGIYSEGVVISQDVKPKSKIKKGRTIYVTVSKGTKIVAVPDVTGNLAPQALVTLKNAFLEEGLQSAVYSGIYKDTMIISQSPPPGAEAAFGYRVNLLKSLGPKNNVYVMPRFTDTLIYDSYTVLRNNGLYIDAITVQDNEEIPSGTIISQSPEAGRPVDSETPISFVITKKESDTSLKRRLIKIPFTLTGTTAPRFVKITIFSLNGSETVYNEVTAPGAVLSINATIMGTALAQVFVGKELVKEYEYK